MSWPAKWCLLALVWGSSFLLMKLGLRVLAPVQVSTLRVVSGLVVVLAMLRATGGRLPRGWRAWAHLSVVGFFLATLPFTLFALGETRVSSALAGIGNAVTPIATTVLTLAFVRDEHFSRPRLAGVVLGFCGVVLVLQPWSLAERPDPLGFAMTLLAGCSYGVGWTWHRLHVAPRGIGGYVGPATQLVAAVPQLLVVLLGWWAWGSDLPAPWSTRPGDVVVPVAAVLVLGLVGTGLAFALQFDVVRDAGATTATSVTYVVPVVSVLLGVLVLGERVTAWTLAGFAVVLAGAVLVSFGNRWAGRRDGA